MTTAARTAALAASAQRLGVLSALSALDPGPGRQSVAQVANPYHFRLYDPTVTPVPCHALSRADEVPIMLIDAMRSARAAQRALGIAAPHVGGESAVIIVPVDGEFTLMINPVMVGHSRTANRGQEGSITTPGFFCSIVRWDRVTVRYEDEYREPQQAKLADLEARIVQHQLDALAGHILPLGMTRQQKRHAARCAEAARTYRV